VGLAVGVPEDVALGLSDGELVGESLEEAEGLPLGAELGLEECKVVGAPVGPTDGLEDGKALGAAVTVGLIEGAELGKKLPLGDSLGDPLGLLVGVPEGDPEVGELVGLPDAEAGELVGLEVGEPESESLSSPSISKETGDGTEKKWFCSLVNSPLPTNNFSPFKVAS